MRLAKQKLQDMTKAGADSAEMWKFFSNELASFEGQMKQRSESINGLVSTMQDNWRLAMAEMGKDLEPLTKKVVKFATKVGQALKDSRKNAADIAVAGGGGRFGFLKGIIAGTTGIGKEDATRRLAQVRDMEAANKKAAETQQAALEKEAAARAEIAQTQKKQLDLNEKLGKAKKTVETARLTAGSRSGALASDRLAKIGGFLGGAAAPEQANADKQLQVLKATKAAIEKQPKELAAALREFFGLGSI